VVLKARIVDGVKVAVTLEQVTIPTIDVVPCCIVKVVLLTVDGDNASLKRQLWHCDGHAGGCIKRDGGYHRGWRGVWGEIAR